MNLALQRMPDEEVELDENMSQEKRNAYGIMIAPQDSQSQQLSEQKNFEKGMKKGSMGSNKKEGQYLQSKQMVFGDQKMLRPSKDFAGIQNRGYYLQQESTLQNQIVNQYQVA